MEFGDTPINRDGNGQETKEQLSAHVVKVVKCRSLVLESVGMVGPCVDGLNS